MGTSLFDRDRALLSLEDIIPALRQGQPLLAQARTLPPMVTSEAAPRAHMLAPVVTTAQGGPSGVGGAHALPAVHSVAAPMSHASIPALPDMAMPGMGLLAQDNSLPGSPSAIASLLERLSASPAPLPGSDGGVAQSGGPAAPATPPSQGPVNVGGITAPAPQAAPMPTIVAPKQPNMMSRIHDWLVDHTPGMDAPGGYEGLLSADEIQRARPSLLSAFIGGPNAASPETHYRENLNRLVEMKQFAAQLDEMKKAKAAQQAMLANRQHIADRFPELPDSASPQQQAQRLMSMFTAYSRAGDTEMAGKMGEVLKSMGNVLEGPKPVAKKPPIEMRLGDHVELLDPDTMQKVGSFPINPSPRDPNAPDTASQLRDQRMFQREQQLSDDYNKDTKSYRELSMKLRNAISEAPQALKGDGASQVNILYAFVNAMDPNSAVREGEIGLVQAGASLRARAQQMIDKYLQTGKSAAVPKEMIDAMTGLMQRRLTSTKDYIDERSSYYQRRAKQWGVDPANFPGIEDDAPRPAQTGAPQVAGLLTPGNVDLANRPRVRNPDGSISTVRSMSFGENGKEILIPTVSDDGRILSDKDAIALYHRTGKHLGVFRDVPSANAYARQLHEDQAKTLDGMSNATDLYKKYNLTPKS